MKLTKGQLSIYLSGFCRGKRLCKVPITKASQIHKIKFKDQNTKIERTWELEERVLYLYREFNRKVRGKEKAKIDDEIIQTICKMYFLSAFWKGTERERVKEKEREILRKLGWNGKQTRLTN